MHMIETPSPAITRFTTLASQETVAATAEALRARGFTVIVAADRAEAKAKVLELIPQGAEVFTAQSATSRELGLFDELDESGRYDSIRKQFASMDRQKHSRQMRKLGAAPDYVVGSVQAITRDGRVVMASYGGAQLASYVNGAGNVIWVVGSHKLVGDMDEAMERVEKHSLPLESERLHKAFGVPSHINKLLIVNGDRPGRTTIILVGEALGY
jgi:NAD(P)-dependent dehydrogenase (short-subunit alcohol dehydrogenase family)